MSNDPYDTLDDFPNMSGVPAMGATATFSPTVSGTRVDCAGYGGVDDARVAAVEADAEGEAAEGAVASEELIPTWQLTSDQFHQFRDSWRRDEEIASDMRGRYIVVTPVKLT